MPEVPERVRLALASAEAAGFGLASDERVGRLLAVLAASVGPGGRVLELGTGTGVGTAWIVDGIGVRADVELVTVEVDAAISALAQEQPWPGFVRFVAGEAVAALPSLGRFDLIFADAQGGKWERLDLTIAALQAGGLLLVDDMTPAASWGPDQAKKQSAVRQSLARHPDLVSCELDWATGVILCARRPPAG